MFPSANIQWDYQYRQLLSEAALFCCAPSFGGSFELDLDRTCKEVEAMEKTT